MADFSKRFEIIYDKFAKEAKAEDRASSKLAFSRFVGVSQGCMQNWEKGQVPAGKDLKAIHDKLQFSYNWLITGEGEPLEPVREEGPSEREKALESRIAELETELREADRVNRQLTARLLIDGVGDKAGATAIGKTADGQK